MSGYFAAAGRISRVPISGGIEISRAQYKAAIEAIGDGKAIAIDGGELAFLDPPVEEGSEPQPVSLAGYAANKRWERETAGLDVGGAVVATDDRSKMMIIGARLAAQSDPEFQTRWKMADGSFVDLNAEQIVTISDAVLAHVDACFQIESAVLAEIASGEITTTEQIDAAFGG